MTPNKRTLQELAQQALDVQNACNLCGVAQSFATAMIELSRYCHAGTEQRNKHSITICWLDKLNSLAKIQPINSDDYFETVSKAFNEVTELANPECPEWQRAI